MIKNLDLYFTEFWWVFLFEDWKLGREDKFGKKKCFGKKKSSFENKCLGGGGEKSCIFKTTYIHFIAFNHFIVMSKNAVETRFFFSGQVNKGQESLLQRLQPICFYIDPWKAILGFSCSEHDGRSFSWCLFWNPFFVPLLLCDSCHVHWLKLNFLTCNVSRMHSHVTLEWKFLYSQCVCLNICIQIKEWKFYLLNYSSASDVK